MRNPNCVHHRSHNDHVKVAADVHDRTRARTLELIQKAGATIRTYSHSSRPSSPTASSSVKRRRRKLRQRRRPPKTSTFHFERRRREKSAGYDADIEFDHQDDDALPDDMVPSVGIFPLAAENRREEKERYFRTRASSTTSADKSLSTDHANQPYAYECQQHLMARMCSPQSQSNTIDNVSIGTAATVATTMSASSATIPTSARQLPFQVGTGPSSPFSLSQNALTMSQAIALSHHAHIIVDALSPFVVKHVNAAFCRILNTYGVSSDVLGEPLLKSSQGQNEIAEQQGSLQRIILEAKKIVLFPIVSEHGGNSHGWEFHANVHTCNNFGRAGTSTGTVGGIINHFLIQIVDENLQRNFMQVIA